MAWSTWWRSISVEFGQRHGIRSVSAVRAPQTAHRQPVTCMHTVVGTISFPQRRGR